MAAPDRHITITLSPSNNDTTTTSSASSSSSSTATRVLNVLSSFFSNSNTTITTSTASASSSSSSLSSSLPPTISTTSHTTTNNNASTSSLHLSLSSLNGGSGSSPNHDDPAVMNHPLVLPSPSHFKRFFLNERSSHPFNTRNRGSGFFHCYNVKTLVSSSHNFSLENSLRIHSQSNSLLIQRSLPSQQQDNNAAVGAGVAAAGTPPPTVVANQQWSPSDLPCMQFNHPSKISHIKSVHTNTQFTYFEVKIAEKMFSSSSSNNAPEIGIGFAPANFKGMVGWAKDTIAFHMDNGRVYDERDSTNRIADRVFLSNVKKGDVIGCLLNHRSGEFMVVRNGQELHNVKHNTVFVNDKFKRHHQDPVKYLPTISCSDINLDIEVNLGLDLVKVPFVYPRVIHCKEREKMFAMVKNHDQLQHSPSLHHGESCCRFSDVEVCTVSEW